MSSLTVSCSCATASAVCALLTGTATVERPVVLFGEGRVVPARVLIVRRWAMGQVPVSKRVGSAGRGPARARARRASPRRVLRGEVVHDRVPLRGAADERLVLVEHEALAVVDLGERLRTDRLQLGDLDDVLGRGLL